MQIVLLTYGANFSLSEEARDGQGGKLLLNGSGIVICRGEQPRAATVASEEEPARDRILILGLELFGGVGEQRVQVFVGRLFVADVKLHGLARPEVIADGNGAAVGIGADDVPNQKIATMEFVAIFTGNASYVQAIPYELLLLGSELRKHFAQLGKCRLASQTEN